jgi:hypothetical protein
MRFSSYNVKRALAVIAYFISSDTPFHAKENDGTNAAQPALYRGLFALFIFTQAGPQTILNLPYLLGILLWMLPPGLPALNPTD